MRAHAVLATLTLLWAATPVLAHEIDEGGHGMVLSDLQLTFDPLTQSAVLSFELANDPDLATGALFARVTMLNERPPQSDVRAGNGLAPGDSGHFDVRVRGASAKACIFVYATAVGTDKASNWACAQTRGLTQAPMALPLLPDDHQVVDMVDALPATLP